MTTDRLRGLTDKLNNPLNQMILYNALLKRGMVSESVARRDANSEDSTQVNKAMAHTIEAQRRENTTTRWTPYSRPSNELNFEVEYRKLQKSRDQLKSDHALVRRKHTYHTDKAREAEEGMALIQAKIAKHEAAMAALLRRQQQKRVSPSNSDSAFMQTTSISTGSGQLDSLQRQAQLLQAVLSPLLNAIAPSADASPSRGGTGDLDNTEVIKQLEDAVTRLEQQLGVAPTVKTADTTAAHDSTISGEAQPLNKNNGRSNNSLDALCEAALSGEADKDDGQDATAMTITRGGVLESSINTTATTS